MSDPAPLRRSAESLGAARVLLDAGFYSQCVSQCYCAAFYAARECLATLGVAPKTHAGTLSSFAKHVVIDRGFDAEVAKPVQLLLQSRTIADYAAMSDTPKHHAEAALVDAIRFVDAVRDWLSEQASQ